MLSNNISWSQFEICCNDNNGIKLRFEDLCRQLFEYEFLQNYICLFDYLFISS